MLKRPKSRTGWSASQWGAAACIAVALLLIAVALMKNGSNDQPEWQDMNGQVDRALMPLELKAADKQDAAKKDLEKPDADKMPDADKKLDADTDRKQEPPKDGTAAEPSKDEADTVPAEGKDAASASGEGKIDINHASAAELDALPGIGAAKAEAIVADRERNGLFQRSDDLLRVKGIGPKLLDKMKSYIVLQP
ncbi:hypothetical protein GZH47_06210 [Paenibacillus rhizovicinus]|uniref:Helix-hairpin-helix DNA-binding motif class 1 domain-containing protein n=1 Tax=Paenibacillus rhizovicinus TaxID=2704463 RepID=A0A6C0NWI0_9BACL|nr:ComEA family DNA-binding protein [Paenibacillus rhizovicinus]QHW30481.1 hypothetical protein GZH47_06210 [Paenibacillus rhizovicinus]